jgi:hypothetical protein
MSDIKAYGDQWEKGLALARELEPGAAAGFYEQLAAGFSDPHSIRVRAMALIEALPKSEQVDLFRSIAEGVEVAADGLKLVHQRAYREAVDNIVATKLARLKAENPKRKEVFNASFR